MGSNLKKIRSLNLNSKILLIGIIVSSGFLGTFLLNNFLRDNYNSRKLEIEKTVGNFFNKKVSLGDYSGIRFLGFSLDNTKIIDTKNSGKVKGDHIYQLSLYSFLLEEAQGIFPKNFYVLLKDKSKVPIMLNDVYASFLKQRVSKSFF